MDCQPFKPAQLVVELRPARPAGSGWWTSKPTRGYNSPWPWCYSTFATTRGGLVQLCAWQVKLAWPPDEARRVPRAMPAPTWSAISPGRAPAARATRPRSIVTQDAVTFGDKRSTSRNLTPRDSCRGLQFHPCGRSSPGQPARRLGRERRGAGGGVPAGESARLRQPDRHGDRGRGRFRHHRRRPVRRRLAQLRDRARLRPRHGPAASRRNPGVQGARQPRRRVHLHQEARAAAQCHRVRVAQGGERRTGRARRRPARPQLRRPLLRRQSGGGLPARAWRPGEHRRPAHFARRLRGARALRALQHERPGRPQLPLLGARARPRREPRRDRTVLDRLSGLPAGAEHPRARAQGGRAGDGAGRRRHQGRGPRPRRRPLGGGHGAAGRRGVHARRAGPRARSGPTRGGPGRRATAGRARPSRRRHPAARQAGARSGGADRGYPRGPVRRRRRDHGGEGGPRDDRAGSRRAAGGAAGRASGGAARGLRRSGRARGARGRTQGAADKAARRAVHHARPGAVRSGGARRASRDATAAALASLCGGERV